MLRVAERSAAEWIVLVTALTLGDHVLLVTGARTCLDAHTQHSPAIPLVARPTTSHTGRPGV